MFFISIHFYESLQTSGAGNKGLLITQKYPSQVMDTRVENMDCDVKIYVQSIRIQVVVQMLTKFSKIWVTGKTKIKQTRLCLNLENQSSGNSNSEERFEELFWWKFSLISFFLFFNAVNHLNINIFYITNKSKFLLAVAIK